MKKKSNNVKVVDRRIRASERRNVREALTPAQQLSTLDKRLGKGVGAARERTRLQKLIDSGKK